MTVEQEFKIVYDGVRYKAEATDSNEEIPRRLKTEIREIVTGESTSDFVLTDKKKEYVKIDVDRFHELHGEESIGRVRYNEISDIVGIEIHNKVLEEFGEEL